MTTQPEALRLADIFDDEIKWQTTPISRTEVAAELRRLHEVNKELVAALKGLNSHGGMSAREQIEIERFVKVAIAKAERTTP